MSLEISGDRMGKEPGRFASGTDEHIKRWVTLQNTLKPWRDIRQTMPLQYVYTFLLVAIHEGRSVQEYADLAGVAQTVMSRHLLDLGSRNRHKEPGFGLIEWVNDDIDLRKHTMRLTPKGKALARRLAEIMGR